MGLPRRGHRAVGPGPSPSGCCGRSRKRRLWSAGTPCGRCHPRCSSFSTNRSRKSASESRDLFKKQLIKQGSTREVPRTPCLSRRTCYITRPEQRDGRVCQARTTHSPPRYTQEGRSQAALAQGGNAADGPQGGRHAVVSQEPRPPRGPQRAGHTLTTPATSPSFLKVHELIITCPTKETVW